MKNTLILISLLFLSLGSCTKKDCSTEEATPEVTPCNDTPPTDEPCLAFFSRWFYNSNTNTCELINYSGCSQKGFETKQACENCK